MKNFNNIITIMSECSISLKASKCLDEIGFNNFPKLKDNLPYSKGPIITSPIIHYLTENEIYDSHGSGNEDFGILIKTIFDIPANRYIRIQTIDAEKFKISWIVEDVDELLKVMMLKSDFDWRIFDKFGFTTKSKIIEIKFNFLCDIDENLDRGIIASGIIDYGKLKKT